MTLGSLKSEASGFLNRYKSENPAAYAAAQQATGGLLILDGFIGIDNPLGGKKRPGIFGSIVGIVVGVVFLLAPTLFGNISGINKLTATTSATVVSVGQPQTSTTTTNGNTNTSTSCSATAKYTVNGQEYSRTSSMSSSNMCSYAAGQTIQINYDPANPGDWGTNIGTIKTVLKVFSWAGIAVIVVSLFTFAIRLLSIIFGWKLLRNGRALAKTLPAGTDLSATVKQIEHEFKTSLFGFGGGAPAVPAQQTAPPAAPSQSAPTAPPAAPSEPAAQPSQPSEPPQSSPPADPQNQV